MPDNKVNHDEYESVGAGVSAFGISYGITSILSALLVILKESSEAIHNVLVVITGHHWVTHGLLDIIIFLVLGFVFYRTCGNTRFSVNTLIMIIVGSTVISGLIIGGYFM
ncbi:hypothetical protein [Photobacterium sp. R1]